MSPSGRNKGRAERSGKLCRLGFHARRAGSDQTGRNDTAHLTASVIMQRSPLGAPALVQAQGAYQQPEAQTPLLNPARSYGAFRLFDVKDLQQAVAVESTGREVVAHHKRPKKNMQSLGTSMAASPEVAAALEQRGLASSHVVVYTATARHERCFTKTA